jgi:hypothetical protein
MPPNRGSLIIVAIRALAAIGLLIIGIYNFVDGEPALGALWVAIGALFGIMAYRRLQQALAEERDKGLGRH